MMSKSKLKHDQCKETTDIRSKILSTAILIVFNIWLLWVVFFLLNLVLPSSMFSKIEMPKFSPQAIVVDKQGNFYMTDDYFRRVCVYDSNGRFLRSWRIPFWGMTLVKPIPEGDQMLRVVSTQAYYNSLIYNLNGQRVAIAMSLPNDPHPQDDSKLLIVYFLDNEMSGKTLYYRELVKHVIYRFRPSYLFTGGCPAVFLLPWLIVLFHVVKKQL